MAARTRPALLYVLASFGLVLGGFGASWSGCQSASLLQSRDQFVAAMHDAAEHQGPAASEAIGSKEDLVHVFERQAEVIYSHRGVALPLGAMNVILSALLFAGCLRAMRGHSWGLSAWSLAAIASVPYTLLDCAFSVVQARDLQSVFRETSGMLGVMLLTTSRVQILVVMVKTALEVLFFGVCVIYLRRPAIRKLFTDDAARS